MQNLIKATKAVFSEFNEASFQEDMLLAEIPGWDSMNSVNFTLELESVFGVNCNALQLGPNSTFADVVRFLQENGVDPS